MAKIRIVWTRSTIGHPETQRRTIRALGLRSLNDSVVRDDSLPVRGMITRVRHLVRVEKVAEEQE